MPLQQHSQSLQDYLRRTAIIDYDHPEIGAVAAKLAAESGSPPALAERTYAFVRDAISHSCDIDGKTVTCRASDVLRAKEGLCYAKSHLLAALLRRNAIPAGFCYQRLLLQDASGERFALHGLNAVYLEERRQWVRLDARGNKPGIDARFSIEEERLAYAVRPEKGEADFLTVYADPDAAVVQALTENRDLAVLVRNLPRDLCA